MAGTLVASCSLAEYTREGIEKLVCELDERRGRQDGLDLQDWLEAERLTFAPSALARTSFSGLLLTSSKA